MHGKFVFSLLHTRFLPSSTAETLKGDLQRRGLLGQEQGRAAGRHRAAAEVVGKRAHAQAGYESAHQDG